MANRAGFEVRDSLEGRAGEVNTQVTSSAASTQIHTGPEVGMAQTEGEQITAAMSRFAPAGSKLLKSVVTEYKEKKNKEGMVLAELKQDLPPDAGEWTAEGYNSVQALNKHYDMVDGFEKWSQSNPQASPDEAQAEWTRMYGETRDAVKPYGDRILDTFDVNSAKSGRGYIKKHTALNTKFVEERNTVALGRTVSGAFKEAAEADENTPEGQAALSTAAELMMALPNNSVGGVMERKARIGMIMNSLQASVAMGNDKMLKIAEGLGPLTSDPDVNADLVKLRKSFDQEQDKKITGEKIAMQGTLRDGIMNDAWSPQVAQDFAEKHGVHMTADDYWSWRDKGEMERNKQATKEALYGQVLAGNGYGVEPDADKLSDAVNEIGQRIEAGAATPTEGMVQRMSWLIKYGYEDAKLKAQFKSVAAMPVGQGGEISPKLRDMVNLWKSVETYAAEGRDLSRQFGEETVAYLRDVSFYSTSTGTDIGIAAKEIQRLRSDKPHMERVERKIESEVEASAHKWRDKYSIDAPRDIAAITERAKMMVRTGMAVSTDAAIDSSIEKFKGDHTKINGRWVAISAPMLNARVAAGARVNIDGAAALKTHFDQPNVKKALGIEGTSFEQMSFVPTADGAGVTVYVNDSNGVAYPVPGVHKLADIGRVSVAAKLKEQAATIAKGGRLDKDTQALDASIRSILAGPVYDDASMYDPTAMASSLVKRNKPVLNGLTEQEIGYNLAQWNALDTKTRYEETYRIAQLSAAKAAGADTTPFRTPARVFKFAEAGAVRPVDSVVQGLINAENGGDRSTFVRTRVTDGEVSSAYGPMQVTKTLAEDVHGRLKHLFTIKEQQFLGRFIEQGKLILKHGSDPLMKDQFGPGGVGTLSAEDKKMYIPVFTKVVKHYMEKYNNNLVRVASVWRYGEGKGTKQDAPAGYLMNFFKNIKQ